MFRALGVGPIINAAGAYTRLGGSRLAPGVAEAMHEASSLFVDIDALGRAVGRQIAAITGNEACIVTSSAAAGIAVAVAACTGASDLAELLPDGGSGREIAVQRSQANGFEAMARLAGVAIRWIGQRGLAASEAELTVGLNARTAAVLVFAGPQFEPALHVDAIVRVARERAIPVIVDAASQLPPISNLRHFTRDVGADLVIFSGGKALGGPQSTGLIFGRPELIEACHRLSSPRMGFARPMKVGKEELLGILAAVEWATSQDETVVVAEYESRVERWLADLADLRGTRAWREQGGPAGEPIPRAFLAFENEDVANLLVDRLAAGTPSVAVGRVDARTIALNPQTVTDEEADVAVVRIRSLLGGDD